MSSLRDIRNRLNSVENIKQITTAMEMVASVRLRRAQAKAEESLPYAKKMKEILENVSKVSGDIAHPLFAERKVNKIGVVIFTGDKGLSGPYNTNILSAADKFLQKYTPNQIELVLIGQKGVDYFRRKKWPVKHTMTDWSGKINLKSEQEFTQTLVNWFLNNELDEIWIISTRFVNVMRRDVVIEKYLNISKPEHTAKPSPYLFEPSVDEIYAQLLPRYCLVKIQSIFANAYAAELAARIFSMKSATKNAEDMIESLTLQRNKLRQAGITKEMLEIISGAEGIA